MITVLSLLLLLAGTLCTQPKQQYRYVAPDSQSTAIISEMKSAFPHISEGIIEFRTKAGKTLLRKDFTSTDGEHGFDIGAIGWTANSHFFVFNLTSSGGHQAWSQPVQVYCLESNKVINLLDYLGPAITEQQVVSLGPPDSLFVSDADTSGGNEVSWEQRSHRVSLSILLRPSNFKGKR